MPFQDLCPFARDLLPACPKNNADGVIGESLCHSRRGIVAADATGRQRMIPGNDTVAAMCNIHLGGIGLLVLPREGCDHSFNEAVLQSNDEKS